MSGSTTVYYAYVSSTCEVMQYGSMTADAFADSTTDGYQQITPDQYTLLTQGGRYMLTTGSLVSIPDTPPLSDAIAAACSIVDVQAEACRRLFVTPGTGMAMVGQMKLSEATAFLAEYPTDTSAAAASPSAWPFLSNEVGLTASDMWGVAQFYSQANATWQAVAVTIERLRLTAKKNIQDAATLAQITAASVVTWPTNPISLIVEAYGDAVMPAVKFAGAGMNSAMQAQAALSFGPAIASGVA